MPSGNGPRGGADRSPSSKTHSELWQQRKADTRHRHISLSYLRALGLDEELSDIVSHVCPAQSAASLRRRGAAG